MPRANKPKFTVKDNFVYLGEEKKAEFDARSRSIKDFYNGGAEIAAEIMQYVKEDPELGWTPEELSDNKIKEAKTIWEIVPEAPSPTPNTLGERHPEVYDYIKENYPNVFKIRYGNLKRWDKDEAGMGIPLSSYRDKTTGEISEASWNRLKKEREEKRENARRILEGRV